MWSEGTLFSGGGLWNLFGRLIPILWLMCAGWVGILWRRERSGRPSSRVLNFIVCGMLLLLTAVTVFFIYVLWAWSQM